MKCLIVAPAYVGSVPVNTRSISQYEYPLGLCYISSALKKAGFEVEGYNCNRPTEPIEQVLPRADVLLTGGLCTHFPHIEGIVKAVRAMAPKLPIIIGGGVVSGEPDFVYNILRPDYAVVGEGEEEVVKVVKDIQRGHKGQPIRYASQIKDIDSIPWADYDLFDVETYLDEQLRCLTYYHWKVEKPRYLPFVASRGCPYGCTFCFHPLGRRYTARNVDDLVAEITHNVKKYRLNIFGVVDECLALDPERLRALCRGLREIGVPWMCQLRVDDVDDALLKELYDAGCYYISYGIESLNDNTLKSMKKKITVAQTEETLQLSWVNNIGIQGNILIADPADTNDSMMGSIIWNLANVRYGISLTSIMPYPNSPLYQKLNKEKVIPSKLAFYRNGCHITPPLPSYTKIDEGGENAIHHTIDMWQAIRPQTHKFELEFIEPLKAFKYSIYHYETSCIWCGAPITTDQFLVADTGMTRLRTICWKCNKMFMTTVDKDDE